MTMNKVAVRRYLSRVLGLKLIRTASMCSVGSLHGWSATHSLEAALSLWSTWHQAVPQA